MGEQLEMDVGNRPKGMHGFTEQDRGVCALLLALGYTQHRIASFFDVNQGRIAEENFIRKGRKR